MMLLKARQTHPIALMVLEKQQRDARQTAVGKLGLPTDVGGNGPACTLGGTCDRFNLFPQDEQFNNSGYKKWENQITRDLSTDGRAAGTVNIQFFRSDPKMARPDSLIIRYEIDGEGYRKKFRNRSEG